MKYNLKAWKILALNDMKTIVKTVIVFLRREKKKAVKILLANR